MEGRLDGDGVRLEGQRVAQRQEPRVERLGPLHVAGVPGLFSFRTAADFKNSKVNIAHLNQGGLSLPDRDYYLNDDAKSVEIRKRYLEHLERMFGLAGGANYGPDLTGLFENFGDEGLGDILKELPFPSMEPIYKARPLTAAEQADLRAFFAKATGTPVANDGLLFAEALSGALIFLGAVWLFGRERLRGVRQGLRKRGEGTKEVAA